MTGWRGPEAELAETGLDFPTLGITAWQWIEENCVIPDGDQLGEPFRLTDEMVRFLVHFYRVEPTGKSLKWGGPRFHYARGGQLVRPQKWGKGPFSAAIILFEGCGPALPDGWNANGEVIGRPWPTPHIQITAVSEEQPLALDTPVATPTGWSTIGELAVGDSVFAPDGSVVRIARLTPVLLNEPCYEVCLSDGECITASGSHAWTLDRRHSHGDRHERVTVTTAELATNHRTAAGSSRYRIPVCEPWQLPDADLPVAPYILGLWLGDGFHGDATIAGDKRLRAEYEVNLKPLLEDHETIVWHEVADTNQMTFRIRRTEGLCRWGHDYTGDLIHKSCGPCRRKEPRTEQRDSLRERLREVGVLRNKHIPPSYLRASADQRLELLRGLMDSDGMVHPNGRAMFTNTNWRLIDGIVELIVSLGYKPHVNRDIGCWRVTFVPTSEKPVARLAYKVARHLPGGRARMLSPFRYVTDVRPVPSVPVRCIGIDTPEHLFLAGRSAVATHNTANIYRALLPMIRFGPMDAELPDTGLTRINLPDGGLIEPVTASALSRLGQRVTHVMGDETHGWTARNGGKRLADNQRRNLSGMGGRFIETTNAWSITEDSVAQDTFENAVGVYVDYPPPIGGSLSNKAERRKAMRHAYGDSVRNGRTWKGWVDLDRIDVEIDALSKRDPAQAERFFLNRVHAGEDVAYDLEAWANAAHPETVVPDKALIAIGVDGARWQDALAIIATTLDGFHQWPICILERPANAGPDYEHDLEYADACVIAAFERFEVGMILSDPQKIEHLTDRWKGRWGKERVGDFVTNLTSRKLGQAVGYHVASVASGDLSHDGDTVFSRHVANARRKLLPAQDDDGRNLFTLYKDRPHSPNKIDAAFAAVISAEARRACIALGMLDKVSRPNWFVGI